MKLKIIYTVLYGILFYIGAKIRILIGIVPIACLLWYFYHNRTLSFLKKKSLWYCGLALIFAMVLSSFIYKTMDKKYNGLPSDNQDVPYTHFVMMGFSANGSYNPDDEIFTASIDTTSERLHGTLAQIKTRLKDMGPVGIIKLFGLKLTSTWSDGYDDYADNFLLSSNYSLINDIIAGDRKDVFVAYLHWYNTFCLLLLVTAALRLMRNSDKYYFTSALILLGGMIFHLVWEAGEAYSMPFFLFLIFAASYGIPTVCRNKKFYQNKRCFLITPALALAVTAIMGICLYKPMTQVKYENTAYAALQDMPVGNAINLKNGQTLTQTFTTSRTFNRIDIGFLPSDEAKEDEACLFRLLDENNQCIYEQTIPANELNSMYNFVIPDVFPGKKQTYTLEFSGMPLNFTGYNTGNWDAYPNGVLSIDSSPCDNTDLTFIVYSVTERTLL